MHTLALGLFLFVQTPLLEDPVSSDLRATRVDALRGLLGEIRETQELVGLQATVTVGGDVWLSQAWGYADLDHDVPLTTSTRMPVASVTKALTGVLYLRLLEQGALQPSQDVRELVPEFPVKSQGVILLDDLVGQMHGIRHYRDEVFPRFFTRHYDRLEDTLAIFADDELLCAPGERFSYSSYAYSLLGVALERAGEQGFLDLLSEEVLQPAGMQRTLSNDGRVPIEGRASCYAYYEFSWPFQERDDLIRVPPLDFSYNAAGGNLLSTTDDLARFGNSLLRGELLSESSWKRLCSSQATRGGEPTGWSHGWFVIGSGESFELRINGSNPGSWAHLRLYPAQGLVIAMATNTWGRGSWTAKGLIPTMSRAYEILRG